VAPAGADAVAAPAAAPGTAPAGASGALLRAQDSSPAPSSAGTALARSPGSAGPERPRLHLVPSAAAAAEDDTEEAPVSVPESGVAKAQAIARATAGALTYEDDGRVSVLFPPPGAVTAVPTPVLAREDAPAPAPAPQAAAPTGAPAPAGAPGGAPAGATLDRDELYQDFMRRLRRDVLEQREQLGELF
jgi:hypothetical protein